MAKKGCFISIFIIICMGLGFSFYLYDSWFNNYKPVKFSIANSKNVVKALKVKYPFVKDITIMSTGRRGIINDNIDINVVLKEIKTPEDVLELREAIMDFVRSDHFLETLGYPGSAEVFKVYYNSEDGNLEISLSFIFKKDDIYTYTTSQDSGFTGWNLYIFDEGLKGDN
jgi:hypothetical protein